MRKDKRTEQQKLIDKWRYSCGNPPYTDMGARLKRAEGVKVKRTARRHDDA